MTRIIRIFSLSMSLSLLSSSFTLFEPYPTISPPLASQQKDNRLAERTLRFSFPWKWNPKRLATKIEAYLDWMRSEESLLSGSLLAEQQIDHLETLRDNITGHIVAAVHVSTSGSLPGIVDPRAEGNLLPFGVMREKGIISYTGELGWGVQARGVNLAHVSFEYIYNLYGALGHVRLLDFFKGENQHKGFEYWQDQVVKIRQRLATAVERDEQMEVPILETRLSIARERVTGFETLEVEDKDFISADFPIIFGIKDVKKYQLAPVEFESDYELAINGPVTFDVIYVPKNRVTEVQNYYFRRTRKKINVRPLETFILFHLLVHNTVGKTRYGGWAGGDVYKTYHSKFYRKRFEKALKIYLDSNIGQKSVADDAQFLNHVYQSL